MNYRRTNTHNNIPFFNHLKQIDSIEKDVFSSCHERGTKKNFDSPWGIELQIFVFLMGTQHFFLCPKLVTRRKKHLSLFLYRAQNLPCLLFLSTNRFHVAATLFSDRSQRMSICDTNIRDTLSCVSYAFLFFFFSLPHFHFVCDLLLNRRTTEAQMYLFFNSKGRLFKQSLAFVYKTAFSAIFNSAEPIIWTFISRSCVTGVEG